MRNLYGSVKNWAQLLKEAHTTLKPGGILECYESSPSIESDDNSIPPESCMAKWGPMYIKAGKSTGRTFQVLEHSIIETYLRNMGMEIISIHNSKVKLLMNSWRIKIWLYK